MNTACQRVDNALQLAPMTVSTLSRCLMLSTSAVRGALSDLQSRRRVVRKRVRAIHTMGAPAYVYERCA